MACSVPLLVLDMLDGMKKEKGNFAARDAIKFLEREFQQKNRFVLIASCLDHFESGLLNLASIEICRIICKQRLLMMCQVSIDTDRALWMIARDVKCYSKRLL